MRRTWGFVCDAIVAIGIHSEQSVEIQLGHGMDNQRRSEIEHDTRQNIPLTEEESGETKKAARV